MGRIYIGEANANSSSSAPIIETVVTAGEAIQNGDLLVLAKDAKVYWSDDPSTGRAARALRPFNVPSVLRSSLIESVNTLSSASNGTASNVGIGHAQLSDGNVIVAWFAKASPYSLTFNIYSPFGELVSGPIIVGDGAASGQADIQVLTLTNGNIAFVYPTMNGARFRFAIYTPSGAKVVAPTDIGTLSTEPVSFSAATLAGGGFAVGYFDGSGKIFRYAVYSDSGNIVKAPATALSVSTVSNYARSTSIIPLANGQFVFVAGASGTVYFYRYDATGTLLGAQTTVGGAASSGAFVYGAALSNGGFAIGWYASGAYYISVWTPSGDQVGSTVTISATGAGSYPDDMALVPTATGNVAVAIGGGAAASPSVAVYSGTTGAAVSGILASAAPVASGGVTIGALSNGDILVTSVGTSGKLYQMDGACNLLATTTITQLATAAKSRLLTYTNSYRPSIPLFSLATNDGSGNIHQGSFIGYMQQCSPIGVSTASAGENGAAPVQVTGVATLRQSFGWPYSIDANSSAVPGQRMCIVGNHAIMQGLQPDAARNIN
ncbi:MAG: hypothetical protein H6R04_690 [Burkholderiaceae bacterium]|nr:hypothetical protein [Burkholderiaceae bacterium]